MIITAKYASECTACGGPIRVGTKIEWEKGKGSRHVAGECPAMPAGTKRGKTPALNSAQRVTPQTQALTDEQAHEILVLEGREFVRPLPSGVPRLRVGDKVTIEGRELEIGSCAEWVGQITDWQGDKREYIVSLIDGAVLESGEYRKTKGITYWTRLLGAPLKLEREGKGSARPGEIFRRNDGSAWLVTSVDKPYYMSREMAEDMDLFDRRGGWSTPFECREVTLSEAEREADAAKQRAKEAAAALQAFGDRVRQLPAAEGRMPEGAKQLRRWSLANHPTYKAPYYKAVAAYELADGRRAYRYTDDYYDWPQDAWFPVDAFFADEPPATEVCPQN